MTHDATKPDVTLPGKSTWNYHPNLPLEDQSLFNLKRGPILGLKLLWNSWLPISDRLLVVGLSFLTWFYLSPSLETARTFAFEWTAAVYLRNLALMVLVAGGMHLYLYTFKRQGNRLRYDIRPFHKKIRYIHLIANSWTTFIGRLPAGRRSGPYMKFLASGHTLTAMPRCWVSPNTLYGSSFGSCFCRYTACFTFTGSIGSCIGHRYTIRSILYITAT